MAKTSKDRLHDVQQAIASIQRLTASASQDDFLANEMLQLAVAFQFGAIGEALKKASELDSSLQVVIPDLRLIVGMRNRIFHAYDEIDFELLWIPSRPICLSCRHCWEACCLRRAMNESRPL
jgi:uncharacterized protein with HEPN domain